MLEQPVRHLFERQADVLEAQFLARDIERHMGEADVHRAHHPRQHGAVADAGIEDPQCRRPRMDGGQFQRDPLRDHPLFAAGVDEQQVFLAVLEETEIASRVALFGRHHEPARRRHPAGRGGGDIGLDAVQRIDGDPLALPQAVHQLAVIDRPPPERRLRHVGLAAEFGDLGENLVVFHLASDSGRFGTAVGSRMAPTHPITICPPLEPLAPTCSQTRWALRRHKQ